MIYIPCHERERMEGRVREIVGEYCRRFGELPHTVTLGLPEDDFGPQPAVSFMLMFDGGHWIYEALGKFEMAGVPAATWRVPLCERGDEA